MSNQKFVIFKSSFIFCRVKQWLHWTLVQVTATRVMLRIQLLTLHYLYVCYGFWSEFKAYYFQRSEVTQPHFKAVIPLFTVVEGKGRIQWLTRTSFVFFLEQLELRRQSGSFSNWTRREGRWFESRASTAECWKYPWARYWNPKLSRCHLAWQHLPSVRRVLVRCEWMWQV